ncbi:hypothetical protein CW709_05185 [Candidatus Bathyarchaeota archaeon]|nr:MAG: hypothetical protein CW709_05185 [Candidatus Bathyarchaeota archaeon]HDN63133.1 hypothetical protein [Candidatus Bathyarchaeota archaeon]
MSEERLGNSFEIDRYDVAVFLARELIEEIKRIRSRLENRYTRREEKVELRRILAKNLATLQRLLEEI